MGIKEILEQTEDLSQLKLDIIGYVSFLERQIRAISEMKEIEKSKNANGMLEGFKHSLAALLLRIDHSKDGWVAKNLSPK
jgi:hypothetical protein